MMVFQRYRSIFRYVFDPIIIYSFVKTRRFNIDKDNFVMFLDRSFFTNILIPHLIQSFYNILLELTDPSLTKIFCALSLFAPIGV